MCLNTRIMCVIMCFRNHRIKISAMVYLSAKIVRLMACHICTNFGFSLTRILRTNLSEIVI